MNVLHFIKPSVTFLFLSHLSSKVIKCAIKYVSVGYEIFAKNRELQFLTKFVTLQFKTPNIELLLLWIEIF